jgi:hypothetical protein
MLSDNASLASELLGGHREEKTPVCGTRRLWLRRQRHDAGSLPFGITHLGYS